MANAPQDRMRPTRKAEPDQTRRDIEAFREPLPQPSGIAPRIRTAIDSHSGVETRVSEVYELGARIGRGGMGEVIAARHLPTNRDVAVKIPCLASPDINDAQREDLRLLWEAQAIARLEHPGIIPLYDIGLFSGQGEEAPRPFYAMRKMPHGLTWSQKLPVLSLADNLDILLRVCDAVAFAHSRKILHRDLKPDNVMLGDYGEVFVMDWGLAASWGEEAECLDLARPLRVGEGSGVGSPAYAAPEQANRMLGKIGIGTDIYLLGAILFEVTAGCPPHGAGDTGKSLRNAKENRIIEPTGTPGDIQGLLAIARKAMSTEPVERHADIKSFQAEIRAWRMHWDNIALIRRGQEELSKAITAADKGDETADVYALFEKAGRLFSSALDLDPHLSQAVVAFRNLGFAQAGFAAERGDLDVAKTRLPAEAPAFPDNARQAALRQLLREKLLHRDSHERRARQFKWGLGAAAALVLIAFAVMKWRLDRETENTLRETETARHNLVNYADELHSQGRASRKANPTTALSRFTRAKQFYNQAGIVNPTLELAIWDLTFPGVFALKKTSSPGKLPGDRVPTRLRKQLSLPFDGSQTLQFPEWFPKESYYGATLWDTIPPSGKPDTVLLLARDNSNVFTLRAWDPEAQLLELQTNNYRSNYPLTDAFGNKEAKAFAALFTNDGVHYVVAMDNGDFLTYPTDANKAKRLPFLVPKGSQEKQPILPLAAVAGIPIGMTSSHDGRLVVTIAEDGTASAIDTASWRRIGTRWGRGADNSEQRDEPAYKLTQAIVRKYEQTGSLFPLAIASDNTIVAIAHGRRVTLWSLFDGGTERDLPSCPKEILAVKFDSRNQILAYAADAVFVYENDVWRQTLAMPLPEGWLVLPHPFSVSDDGVQILRQLAHSEVADEQTTWREDGRFTLEKWDLNNNRLSWSAQGLLASCLTWRADGEQFAIWDGLGDALVIHSATDGVALDRVADLRMLDFRTIFGLAFSPNGRQLACIDSHNRFTLWDRGEKGATLEWPIGESPIFSRIHTGKNQVLILPDGSLVLADLFGDTVKHLFGSTIFVNRHASFAVGMGRKDTADDLVEADTDYVRHNGGYLIKVDLPW